MKRHKTRNKQLAIKGNPLFGQRIVGAKKGKGSYKRKDKHKTIIQKLD